jgi:hypothetical protein
VTEYAKLPSDRILQICDITFVIWKRFVVKCCVCKLPLEKKNVPKAFLTTGDDIACGKESFWFFCRVGAPLPWGRKQIRFPKRCVFLFVEIPTMDKVQKPSSNECYTPSSEPFRKKNVVFWDVQPRCCCKNRHFGSMLVFLRSVFQLLVTDNFVPSSSILVTQMIEPIRSLETSDLTRAEGRNIP